MRCFFISTATSRISLLLSRSLFPIRLSIIICWITWWVGHHLSPLQLLLSIPLTVGREHSRLTSTQSSKHRISRGIKPGQRPGWKPCVFCAAIQYCDKSWIHLSWVTLRTSYYLQAVQYLPLYIILVFRHVMLNDNVTKWFRLPLSLCLQVHQSIQCNIPV